MNRIINDLDQSGVEIKSNWRDIVKDFEICFILMIVDDIRLNEKLKREDLLDPNTRFIGISSKLIELSFASYVTLA